MNFSMFIKIAVLLIVGIIVTYFFDLGELAIGIGIFEWITRFILPWIALYWFIRFVNQSKKSQ